MLIRLFCIQKELRNFFLYELQEQKVFAFFLTNRQKYDRQLVRRKN